MKYVVQYCFVACKDVIYPEEDLWVDMESQMHDSEQRCLDFLKEKNAVKLWNGLYLYKATSLQVKYAYYLRIKCICSGYQVMSKISNLPWRVWREVGIFTSAKEAFSYILKFVNNELRTNLIKVDNLYKSEKCGYSFKIVTLDNVDFHYDEEINWNLGLLK